MTAVAPEVGVLPEAAAAPEVPAEPVKPARKLNRKALGLVAAGVAAAALLGGGAWGAAAIGDADRTAPTRYWVADGEKTESDEPPAAVPSNELSGKLLPLPSAFTLGPDLADDGNNFFVSGENAVQGFKDARQGLSSKERKQRDEALAELKLKGLAGRSYANTSGRVVYEVRIMQADPQALGKFSEVSKKFIDLLGDGRDAPKIDGFPDAKCSLLAIGEEKKEKIDSLECVAIEGDVLVNFRAYGPKPFSGSDAAAFFKKQLTHLKSPGESV
ncbi:hypothetical protein OG625_17640 [Streptomyces sp. NBC_01351]|uniref:hypothetical protein n=1 Tax=Streptomyces sp. NBC_01351 TaxID=2903833 RepID=UPI002E32F2CF|nr:hypothetical protein [Streptomyces sp. NBC_01351]